MQQDSDESWPEDQYSREIEQNHTEYENSYSRTRDNSLSAVHSAFTESATAVAHLYRERASNTYPDTAALWLPFQTAAGTVTTLYRDSCEGIKRTSEAAAQCGYQRRTRELADWARSKKRRMIRREDLLAYLAGKPPPPTTAQTNRRSPKPENTAQHNAAGNNNISCANVFLPNAGTNQLPSLPHQHGAHQFTVSSTNEATNDLHTFKEALSLRPRGPELFAFVANEIARHCKRPASPIDDKMDGGCHYGSTKRQRFM